MGHKRGSLEHVAKKRSRRGSLESLLLRVLLAGGIMTVALAAPKVAALLKKEHIDAVLPPDPRQRLRETAARLARKGWVSFEEKNGRTQMRITRKGMREISRVNLGAYTIRAPSRWDERWRVVIFDIPEKRRVDRIRIRNLLVQLGFYRLQDSVWVHPYDCEEIITLIKAEYKFGTSVRYLVADVIEFENPIRTHFGLPVG